MIDIQKNVSLQNHTTFGVAARAKFFCEITTVEQLQWLFVQAEWRAFPKLILGGGSNMLFATDYDGLVIKISIEGKTIIETQKFSLEEDLVLIKSGAGENWQALVAWTLAQGFGGIENLSWIPGTVGAAPVQNIGAYGAEIETVFHSLQAIEIATGRSKIFTQEAMEFGYRDSVFKNDAKDQYVIVAVCLELTKTNHQLKTAYGSIATALAAKDLEPSIDTIAQVVVDIRRQKLPDPTIIGNAGSFFKNPIVTRDEYDHLKGNFIDMLGYEIRDARNESPASPPMVSDEIEYMYKIPAAWLIDQCGWKGFRIGDAGVHEHQPLVLVNYGTATGAEILALSEQIQSSVFETFGIWLEREINIIKV